MLTAKHNLDLRQRRSSVGWCPIISTEPVGR
jgi:hypothetical protein